VGVVRRVVQMTEGYSGSDLAAVRAVNKFACRSDVQLLCNF
jgi:hypothetical protein